MKIRRGVLILMMLTWPHQSYAQSRAPSTEPYTVGSWFGAMGDDFVYALQAPSRWSPRDGLKMTTLTLTLVGLVHLADEDIDREFAQDEGQMLLKPARGLLPLGEKYDTISSTNVILGLTSAFLISGVALDQPRQLETARLLLEAYVIVNGVGVIGKQVLGRARPYVGNGSRDFNLIRFSGQRAFRSMPSGHSLKAFATMTVVAKRYPHWWVQLPAYSVAGGVAVQRIDSRNHWVSDVVLGGTIGYLVARMLVDHGGHQQSDLPKAIRPVFYPTGMGLAIAF